MSQTAELVNTLKRALKSQGLTYADVARQLDLSEGSVKRLFSEKHFSMHRFEQICQMMEMNISDIVQLMQQRSSKLVQLTREQEDQLVKDRKLLLVTVCALNRWTLEDILSVYKLNKTEIIHCLATLDRMQLIELLAGNKIKLLVSSNFHWIDNGPIQQFFNSKLAVDIFDSRFDRQTEKLVVANAMLSRQSNAVLQQKVSRLLWEFEQLNSQDAALEHDVKQGTTLVMAIRDWHFGFFADLKR